MEFLPPLIQLIVIAVKRMVYVLYTLKISMHGHPGLPESW